MPVADAEVEVVAAAVGAAVVHAVAGHAVADDRLRLVDPAVVLVRPSDPPNVQHNGPRKDPHNAPPTVLLSDRHIQAEVGHLRSARVAADPRKCPRIGPAVE